MKISYKGDYAIKALLFLSVESGKGEERYFQIPEISRAQDIPEKFLEQIFLLLRKAGYLKSHRGANGGFSLNRGPEKILLGEIIRLIDGPVEPIACASENGHQVCDFEECCVLKPLWVRVGNAVSEIVDKISFADLARDDQELKKRLAMGLVYHI